MAKRFPAMHELKVAPSCLVRSRVAPRYAAIERVASAMLVSVIYALLHLLPAESVTS